MASIFFIFLLGESPIFPVKEPPFSDLCACMNLLISLFSLSMLSMSLDLLNPVFTHIVSIALLSSGLKDMEIFIVPLFLVILWYDYYIICVFRSS